MFNVNLSTFDDDDDDDDYDEDDDDEDPMGSLCSSYTEFRCG